MLEQHLRTWSARTGKSRADAADELGVAYGTLCTWARGERTPRAPMVHRIAELVGCDPLDLLRSFDRTADADNPASVGGDDGGRAPAANPAVSVTP